MPGYIYLYHKESKSIIGGGALVIEKGELEVALSKYTLDIKETLKPVGKFFKYDIDRIVCYYGAYVH